MLPQRTADELDAMRAAGRVVAQTLAAVRAAAVPGVKLRELDDLARTTMYEAGATSSFLGYKPAWAPTAYNGALCLSPNEVVVHGRPSGQRLKEGDLLSVDCGAIVDGWHGDAAVTLAVGTGRPADLALSAACREALDAGIDTLIVGEGPHHTFVQANDEAELTVIYAGHYATETLGVRALAAHVGARFDVPWTFVAAPTGS